MEILTESALEPKVGADVLSVAVRAATFDGVKPLSEQTVLDIGRMPAEVASDAQNRHLVVVDQPGEINASVLAYAHLERGEGEAASAEIVVHPDHRRQGHGGALLKALRELSPKVRVWSHGQTDAAKAFAEHFDLQVVRELLQMSRPLGPDAPPLAEVSLPDGFSVRSFEVGRDEQHWLAVNAAAFVDHPEQGRVTLSDLKDRIAEPWFDPHGFLLIEDGNQSAARLAAFHWTKVEAAEPGSSQPADGEVYVVGVDPDYQGLGLGKAATLAGLHHLQACRLPAANLYVDGDNEAAVATYTKLGFERSALDVMYAPSASE